MRLILTAAALMLATALPAAAQQRTPERPTMPSQAEQQRPPTAPEAKQDKPAETLSDQLAETGGVIKPKGQVDPEMSVPAPSTGPNSMPVIPPPGTPGNAPHVQPK